MDREELLQHIHSSACRSGAAADRLTAQIFDSCWPGGSDDRTERAALDWLRQWHPDGFASELPTCSCKTGRCVLCN